MPSPRWESRGRRDRGAVAVETSIVSMLLVTLLFGIIECSFLFKDWISVSGAARAGARMGASQPRISTFAQDAANQVTNALSDLQPARLQAVWVYRTTGATGQPPAQCNNASDCVPFTWDSAQLKLTTTVSANWLYTDQNACAGDPNRDSIGVYVSYMHSSPLGFFFKNMIINESTVMWIEPMSTSTVCKP